MKFWEHLLAIVATVTQHCDTCEIVHSEADSTPEHQAGAQEFLKINGQRVGQDFRAYRIIAVDPGQVLSRVAEDILVPLQRACPHGFGAALDRIDHFGRVYLDDEQDLENWKAIWRA